MTLPSSGSSQKFSVLLEFSTNEALFDEIEKKTEGIVNAAERAKEMTRLYSEEIKKTYPELYKQIEAEKKQAEALEKSKEAAKKNSVEIRNLRAEARLITKEVALLRDQAEDLDRVFRPLALIGGVITGGIFAAANKYVKDATEATQVTREWKAAQADLEKSGKEIGAVLAQEALPILKEVAKVSKQIADIIQRNPELAKAALYGGMLALAVGTIGKLYTSGLRLYADDKLDKALLLQMVAAERQFESSKNQLVAAELQSKGGAGKGFLSQAKSIAPLAGPIGAGVLFSTALFAGIIKMDLAISNTIKELTGIETPLLKFSNYLKGLRGDFEKTANANQSIKPQQFLGGSKETQDQAVKVFSDWRRDDARIVKDATNERKKIVSAGEKEIADITAKYTSERSGIASKVASSNKKAEDDYNKFLSDQKAERIGIIKDSEEKIREIRKNAEEKRQEAEKQFTKDATRAAADRDALALVQAQEARDEALAQADTETDQAIQKEKTETAKRLAEFDIRFTKEREQRYQQYQETRKENAERLRDFDKQHQAELRKAREANEEKIKEFDQNIRNERTKRREGAISQLQELGLVLNNERQLRSTAYNAMLGDLRMWLSSMNATFGIPVSSLGVASGGTSSQNINPNFFGSGMFGAAQGIHDYSGYAYRGIYKMAQNGQPQWVMAGNDTRAAENAIGGKLTSSSMAQMIALMASARGSREFVDNSVYGKDMTVRQIRDIKEMSDRRIEKLLGGY